MPTERTDPDVPGPRRPEPDPSTARYDLFLEVARDLDRVTTAYDAELLVSTMLGAAYAVADRDRAAVLTGTAEGLRRHLARRRTRTASLLRTVLGEVGGVTTRSRAAAPAEAPGWLPHVGVVHPTGTYAFGDDQGNQTTYLACFAYDDTDDGGPEHVVAALVDHRAGHVRDLFVAAPAGALLAQLQAAATTDEDMRLVEVDPGELRTEVERFLSITDELPELPEARSLTSDRALATHRLRLLPEAAEEPPLTIADFQAAPESSRVSGADPESLTFALKLIVEYSQQDALRWTPDGIADFLLEWVPAKALLDRADSELLPAALSAWVRWAGRVSGLSPREVAQNVATVARHKGEFTRRIRSDDHRSPAVRAMAQLLKDGVDINDEKALAEWLDDYNAREEGAAGTGP
ncbi:hypothetical protein Val02_41550 [Virgisporangium aliadipatigenens]|uniref:Uncharacterized protein n=1 Tax=Virgisporangium aliadipatigenens TaxID=741659 RepID=A0A8J3YKW8_9ACTN|nr:hypothetical protein [Virgisporangium aliadipatigenens]GIJ47269.1 hypothetical protein Val02_41550 [Virgisporangium aliadipatigenens]